MPRSEAVKPGAAEASGFKGNVASKGEDVLVTGPGVQKLEEVILAGDISWLQHKCHVSISQGPGE